MSAYDDFLFGNLQDPNNLLVCIPLIEQTTKNWETLIHSDVFATPEMFTTIPKYHIMYKNYNGDTILHYICKSQYSKDTDTLLHVFNKLMCIYYHEVSREVPIANVKNDKGFTITSLLTYGKQSHVKRILLDTLQLHLKVGHLNSNPCCTNRRT